jgi:NADPH-dependent 2,4-dienoyl-CoA reductase/sulfur reductase-like enzyme/rhodanese-related sulfurtransferase
VVVGGVAGGMSAATRARRLCESATITVFEKSPFVSYANCGIPYALGGVIESDAKLILNTSDSFKHRFNINVHTNAEVVSIDRVAKTVTVETAGVTEQAKFAYDKLILAQGAESFRLPIPGADLPEVFTLQTINDLQHVKTWIADNKSQKAVVIGGGFIGLEAAENLKQLGLEVTIIEYADHILPTTTDVDMAGPIHAELRRQGVRLLLNSGVTNIDKTGRPDHVNVWTSNGVESVADIVLMAVGVRARTSLAKAAGLEIGKTGVTVNQYMQTSDHDIYAVGDMVETKHRVLGSNTEVALAGPANRQGRLAADHIFGKRIAYRGNVGTTICKVFDMSIGSTGLTVAALKRLGRAPEWITVHPPDHAGYYPGAISITLRVIFNPESGLLLGAQGVGKKGVDKRIDVLSTAIQAEMRICDLEHLELAYAPPFGAAKDAVNMAGFVGSNVHRVDVRIAHPEDLTNLDLNTIMQIIDVRSPSEFAGGHVKTAINIPIDTLRQRVHEIQREKTTLVYCQVGYRGYLAFRILAQLGFDVVNLDGGFKSVLDGGHLELQEVPTN